MIDRKGETMKNVLKALSRLSITSLFTLLLLVGGCTGHSPTTSTTPTPPTTPPTTPITPTTPSIDWIIPSSITFHFGTPLSSTQLDATSSVPGTFVYNPPVGTFPAVGNQTLTVTFTPTNTTDYSTTTKTVTLLVSPAAPVISWSAPATITYGTSLSNLQLDATANVPGVFAYTPDIGTIPTVGIQTLSVLFTPTDSTDYVVNNKSVTLVVSPVMAPDIKSVQGFWRVLPYSMTINPIHAMLLNTGNVLFLQGSGNCTPTLAGCPKTAADYPAALWNPLSGVITTITNYTNWDMFCNGAVSLADGRILINGGTASYAKGSNAQIMMAMGHKMQPATAPGTATVAAENTPGHHAVPMNARTNSDIMFTGETRATIFDPNVPFSAASFTNVASMHSVRPDGLAESGRWYPTTIPLSDGRALTFGGQDSIGNDNDTVEYYTPSTDQWSQEYPAVCATSGDNTLCNPASKVSNEWYPQLYPRLFLLPNGKIFNAGSDPQSSLYDIDTNLWDFDIYHTNSFDIRTYGSATLLPLTAENNYNPKVIIMGGASNVSGNGPGALSTTEIIDLGASNPMWVDGPLMTAPRIEMQAVQLPNDKVLVFAGSSNDEDASTATLAADIYDPATNTMTLGGGGAGSVPRLYHNTALLLPDGTIMSAGSNPTQGVFEPRMEIYQPAYLFNTDGTLATRPTMTGVPSQVTCVTPFTIHVPNAGDIASVRIIREGANTHSFDMSARSIGLSFTADKDSLTITGPPSSDIAPPGFYMLFIMNTAGVPSVAQFIQVK